MDAMVNNILNTSIFEIMDEAASNLRVTDILWAEKSGIGESPRISELRRKTKLMRAGDKEGAKALGRALTIEKCQLLMNGLKQICGAEMVSKEIAKLLKSAKNETEKVILLALASTEEENRKTAQIQLTMKEDK